MFLRLPFCYLLVLLWSVSTINAQDIQSEISAIENGLLRSIQIEGEPLHTYNLKDRMAFYSVPGISIAVLKDGKLRWAKGYGAANTETGTSVDEHTLFQAGSISKPLAALSVLHLLDQGKVALDTDVHQYLKDWKITVGNYADDQKVTIRRLLTHTAGMTVHGFPGYKQDDQFPSITTVLNGEGNTPQIQLDTFPDAIWRYSGGGYTVMEKVVEDVSGLPLEDYMAKHIFPTLEMSNSTFAQPLPSKWHAQASAAYNGEGAIIEGYWHNYPEQAAAGLWTTPTDLAKYFLAIQKIMQTKQDGVLSYATTKKMLTPHKNNWGLGPMLEEVDGHWTFGHGGKNAGFTNNMFAFVEKGDGIIVMTNADRGGALIREIMSAAAQQYDWGFAKPNSIKLADLSATQLKVFAGKYKMDESVPGVGDYYVSIETTEKGILVIDLITQERHDLLPLSETRFIDVNSGDQAQFSMEEAMPKFVWNRQFHFTKMKP